ncbi:MAG: recombinase family protein [Nitrospira sp.]|nr:recombinase family protein [Nitrospira sp.]
MKDHPTRRAAIYARVSTDGQTTENQLRELRVVAERNGWTIVHEFIDRGISGAKGRDQRPAFDALWKGATRREFDVVMTWAVDRLGRSLAHLVNFLSELHAKKVDLYIHQQGLDTSTPAGKALFGMMGVFAEFERSMIQERVKAGIKRVRAKGRRWGRRKIEETDPTLCTKVIELRQQGHGMGRIGKTLGLSSRTVWRFLRQMSVNGTQGSSALAGD